MSVKNFQAVTIVKWSLSYPFRQHYNYKYWCNVDTILQYSVTPLRYSVHSIRSLNFVMYALLTNSEVCITDHRICQPFLRTFYGAAAWRGLAVALPRPRSWTKTGKYKKSTTWSLKNKLYEAPWCFRRGNGCNLAQSTCQSGSFLVNGLVLATRSFRERTLRRSFWFRSGKRRQIYVFVYFHRALSQSVQLLKLSLELARSEDG